MAIAKVTGAVQLAGQTPNPHTTANEDAAKQKADNAGFQCKQCRNLHESAEPDRLERLGGNLGVDVACLRCRGKFSRNMAAAKVVDGHGGNGCRYLLHIVRFFTQPSLRRSDPSKSAVT